MYEYYDQPKGDSEKEEDDDIRERRKNEQRKGGVKWRKGEREQRQGFS